MRESLTFLFLPGQSRWSTGFEILPGAGGHVYLGPAKTGDQGRPFILNSHQKTQSPSCPILAAKLVLCLAFLSHTTNWADTFFFHQGSLAVSRRGALGGGEAQGRLRTRNCRNRISYGLNGLSNY